MKTLCWLIRALFAESLAELGEFLRSLNPKPKTRPRR